MTPRRMKLSCDLWSDLAETRPVHAPEFGQPPDKPQKIPRLATFYIDTLPRQDESVPTSKIYPIGQNLEEGFLPDISEGQMP